MQLAIYSWKKNTLLILRYPMVNYLTLPAKILSPFLLTAPLHYAPKIQFTPDTSDCLTTNKTKNVLLNETVILGYIDGDPISHGLHN